MDSTKKRILIAVGSIVLIAAAFYGFLIWKKKKQLDAMRNSGDTTPPSYPATTVTNKPTVKAPQSDDYTKWKKGVKLYAKNDTLATRTDMALSFSSGAYIGNYAGEMKPINGKLNALLGIGAKAYYVNVDDLKTI